MLFRNRLTFIDQLWTKVINNSLHHRKWFYTNVLNTIFDQLKDDLKVLKIKKTYLLISLSLALV